MTEIIWIVNNFSEYLCVNPHEDWEGSNVFLPIFLRPLGNYWEFSYSSASFSLVVLRRPLWKRGTRREQASCGLHRPHTANSGHYIAKEFQLFGKELFPILILTQFFGESKADKQLVHLCHQALLVDFFAANLCSCCLASIAWQLNNFFRKFTPFWRFSLEILHFFVHVDEDNEKATTKSINCVTRAPFLYFIREAFKNYYADFFC